MEACDGHICGGCTFQKNDPEGFRLVMDLVRVTGGALRLHNGTGTRHQACVNLRDHMLVMKARAYGGHHDI